MLDTISFIVAIIAGFAVLIWGADRFVQGASSIARLLYVSRLVVGMVIVGFGTSAPEILVGSIAALDGNTGIAIGNALGSNITNVGLVLGITALVTPLAVQSKILRREFPVLFLVMGVAFVLFMDGELTRTDGVLLLLGLVGFLYWMLRVALKDRSPDPLTAEAEEEIPETLPMGKALTALLIGLLCLLGGAKLVVWGAVGVAHLLGISDLIIGLTIVAIGTSLPELAASIASARKNEHELAIGNIIGSNLFNLFAVLGIPILIKPAAVETDVLYRDYPVMVLLALALFFMARGKNGAPGHVTRWEGATLAVIYFAYLAILYVMST